MYCNIIDPFKSVSGMGFGVQLKTSNSVNSLTALYCALLRIKKFNMNRFRFKTQFSSTRIVSNLPNSSQIFVQNKRSRSFSQLPYGKAKNALFYH